MQHDDVPRFMVTQPHGAALDRGFTFQNQTNIYIFNFFPTSQSDEHLGLENNIKAKIQAFHETLGEDARYLSDEEELSSHELFGDRLYKKLSSKESLESESEEE